MRYFLYSITIFFGLLILPIAHAEDKYLTEYIENFKYQYQESDKVEFDKNLEQEILEHIENNYLKPYPNLLRSDAYHSTLHDVRRSNPLALSFTPSVAKLLLYYGGHPFGGAYFESGDSVLLNIIEQDADLNQEKTLKEEQSPIVDIMNDLAVKKTWDKNIPRKTIIDIMKLYIALGTGGRIDNTTTTGKFTDAFRNDISIFNPFLYASLLKFSATDLPEGIVLGDTHNAKYIRTATDELAYLPRYRTSITYWLEEFASKSYPASMLDTHPLLYPRFMQNASVGEVTDMLNNPEAHKIPINKNCPYRGAAIETGFEPDPDIDATCPLTPSINLRDAMGRTPLHIAGEQENQAVYDYLIWRGEANISIEDFRGNLPTLIGRNANTNNAQTRNKNKNMQHYFTTIADIEFSPSVQAQLPDYEKILIKITIYEQKPSDDELEKLSLLYDELQQHDALHALPRLTQYYIKKYRARQ